MCFEKSDIIHCSCSHILKSELVLLLGARFKSVNLLLRNLNMFHLLKEFKPVLTKIMTMERGEKEQSTTARAAIKGETTRGNEQTTAAETLVEAIITS